MAGGHAPPAPWRSEDWAGGEREREREREPSSKNEGVFGKVLFFSNPNFGRVVARSIRSEEGTT